MCMLPGSRSREGRWDHHGLSWGSGMEWESSGADGDVMTACGDGDGQQTVVHRPSPHTITTRVITTIYLMPDSSLTIPQPRHYPTHPYPPSNKSISTTHPNTPSHPHTTPPLLPSPCPLPPHPPTLTIPLRSMSAPCIPPSPPQSHLHPTYIIHPHPLSEGRACLTCLSPPLPLPQPPPSSGS